MKRGHFVWTFLGPRVLLVLLFARIPAANAQTPGTFTPAGNMATPRYRHTATLLPNGKVLIAGGSETATAEIYDPSSGSFTATGDMTTPRSMHTATLLADGRVLLAGGYSSSKTLAGAEIYDPSTGAFTPTGDMVTAQFAHTATLLNDGTVLIAGGEQGPPWPTSVRAELYDPSTGKFVSTGNYAGPNSLYPAAAGPIWPTATRLPDGKVLFAGDNPAELYDPVTRTFSLAGRMVSSSYRYGMYWHAATLLPSGRVIVTGGTDDFFDFSDAEAFEPSTGRFAASGKMLTARELHTSTLLTDGTVLIAGGGDGGWGASRLPSAELYDPETAAFSSTSYMATNRSGHTSTLLKTGEVLVTGGVQYWPFRTLETAELYTPRVVVPAPVVTALGFDPTTVAAGGSYSVNLSGANLTSETFFDVRFSTPEGNAYAVVLNWQRGATGSHSVSPDTTPGSWTIRGVRAHRIETDHTGDFDPVSSTITVSP